MSFQPRPYRNRADLDRMRALLIEGRKANNGTYYVHVGDVNWWLFYPNQEKDFPERIFLWEDGGSVIGWSLFSPGDRAFDVYVHPTLPFDQYWPRYQSFMRSEVYEAERDRVVAAPDGRFAAFCIY